MIQYGIAQPYEYIYWPLLNLRYIQIISTRLFSLRSLGRPGHHAAAPHQPRRRSLRRLRGLRGLRAAALRLLHPLPRRREENGHWNPAMVGTLLWNFTGSTWFNMVQPIWWKMSALWLWDCCLHYTGICWKCWRVARFGSAGQSQCKSTTPICWRL